MDQGFRLVLGTAPDEAKRLRNELHAWLLHVGIAGATRHDIAVAAHESFLNAVNHHLDDPDVNIYVEGEITDTDVIVTVSKPSAARAASARAEPRGLQLLADPPS
jgi:anti-sigma regulatory factor (Ser/Thr protein kinase)